MRDGTRRRRAQLLTCGAAIGVAVMLVAGCGGGDDGGGGTSQGDSASKLSGSPIKVMTIGPTDSPAQTHPEIATAAKAYEGWTNSHGGINGHPLEVETCDDKGDPSTLAACGRKAISEKVVAVVGSWAANAAPVIPQLEAANVAWFGVCCPHGGTETTSPVSFPIGSGLTSVAGLSAQAARDGCQRIGLVVVGAGSSFVSALTLLAKNGIASVGNGARLAKVTVIPLTAQDYGPQVAQATSGTDCLNMQLGENNFLAWMPALEQSGAKLRLYSVVGNYSNNVIAKFPEASEGITLGGVYADFHSQAYANYRAALEDADAPKDQPYDSLQGSGAWTAYEAFADIAKGIKGEITNETFLEAVRNSSTVDTGGQAPSLDFTKEYTGLEGFNRQFNRSVTYYTVTDGKLKAIDAGKFVDETASLSGTGN